MCIEMVSRISCFVIFPGSKVSLSNLQFPSSSSLPFLKIGVIFAFLHLSQLSWLFKDYWLLIIIDYWLLFTMPHEGISQLPQTCGGIQSEPMDMSILWPYLWVNLIMFVARSWISCVILQLLNFLKNSEYCCPCSKPQRKVWREFRMLCQYLGCSFSVVCLRGEKTSVGLKKDFFWLGFLPSANVFNK